MTQIYKTGLSQTIAPKAETTPTADVAPGVDTAGLDPETAQDVVDFFEQDESGPVAPLPSNPFDLLGASGVSGGISNYSDISVKRVVPLEELLLANPEMTYNLDLILTKYNSKLNNVLIPRKLEIEEKLRSGNLSANATAVLRSQKENIENQIIDIRREIEKTEARQSEYQAQCRLEMSYQTDLNGDGIIGDKNDPNENYLIVAKHPDTHETVLLNPDRTPAGDMRLDPEYKPALTSVNNVNMIAYGENGLDDVPEEDRNNYVSQEERTGSANGSPFDIGFQIRYEENGFFDNTFGAQLDIATPEVLWVKLDRDGEILKNENGSMVLKRFEMVEREDQTGTGEKMWGQNPPTRAEASHYKAIRVNKIEARTEPAVVDGEEIAGGHVYLEFYAKIGEGTGETKLTTMRFEGVDVNADQASHLKTPDTNYVAASSVGLAFHAGKTADGQYTEHSSRFRPIELNASGYHSTGKILPADVNDAESIRNFYRQLEIYDATTSTTGVPPFNDIGVFDPTTIDDITGDADTKRARRAANDTLMHGFLAPDPWEIPGWSGGAALQEELLNRYPLLDEDGQPVLDENGHPKLTSEGLEESNKLKTTLQSLANKFNPRGNGNRTNQTYIGPTGDEEQDKILSEQITGVFCKDLRGNLTGTGYQDIFVVPEAQEANIKQLLPLGASEILDTHAAYGTTVDAKGGRNILVSKGGDIYAKGITFFWREPALPETEETPRAIQDIVEVTVNNVTRDEGEKNNRVYVHITDANSNVSINNGEFIDGRIEGDSEEERIDSGLVDDWYDVQNADFAYQQNDLPIVANVATSGDEFKSGLDDAAERIRNEAINANPLASVSPFDGGGWDMPEGVQEGHEVLDSFFDEWEWFADQEPLFMDEGDFEV